MRPLVTAVIPAYNAERYLAAAISSVLAQTYPHVELVVVDDGSMDGTGAIAEGFPGVRYVRQPNRGVSVARNRGAELGRGEYVAFLDADDEWLPKKLEVQVSRMATNPGAVASFTATIYADERQGGESVLPCRVEPDMVTGLLLHSCIVGPPSAVLVRRDVFMRLGGFDPALSQCADWDMWIRLAEAGPLDVVDIPLVRYRVHQGNMSRDVRLLESDTLRVLAKFFADAEHGREYGCLRERIYSNHYLILSGSYLHAGALAESVRCLTTGVRCHPRNVWRALGFPYRFLRRRLRGAIARVTATHPLGRRA